jgi:hypothetical protein
MTIRTQVSVPAKATIAAEVYTFRPRQYIFVGLDGDRRSRNEYSTEDMCGRFTLHSRDRIRLSGLLRRKHRQTVDPNVRWRAKIECLNLRTEFHPA